MSLLPFRLIPRRVVSCPRSISSAAGRQRPEIAANFIEQGATKVVAEIGLHFCDENSASCRPNITTGNTESVANST